MSDKTTTRGGARGVVFALLCMACLALAIGYSWRASARRAALFGDDALPAIANLDELDVTPAAPTSEPTEAPAETIEIDASARPLRDVAGVEDAPGVKNVGKIKAFLAAARPEAGRAD